MPYSNERLRTCEVTVDGKRRCAQCGKVKAHPADFIGLRGGVIARCGACALSESLRRTMSVRRVRRLILKHTEALRILQYQLRILTRSRA